MILTWLMRHDGSTGESERELQSQLQLSRVANALTQKTVEIEESGRHQRVDEVRVIEGIEHLDDRDQPIPLSEMERALQSPVEREVAVVFAQRIATSIHAVEEARAGSDRLRRMRLNARVKFQAPGQFHVAEKVESMTNVSVREGIVPRKVETIEGAVGERVALVGIVVHVFGPDVVRFKLIFTTETFPHSNRETTIKRFGGA
jgi:hypothetical protein